MISIPNSVLISEMPYKGLEEVADILYYEGPRIVHYRDERNNNFIYQWIDEDDSCNRWLIYKTAESSIIDYVTGIGTVEQMLPADLDYMVALDTDYSNKARQILLFQAIFLPEDYRPLPDSYYSLPTPAYYADLIEQRRVAAQLELKVKDYEIVVGQKAFYLNLAPKKKKNGTNLTLSQITKASKEIQSSYNSYYAIAFHNTFGIAPAKRKAELVAVNAGKGSFGIALASEFLDSASSGDSAVYEFNKDAALQFKKDVLEADLSSADGIQALEAKFTSSEIKSIFTPIIKLVNDKKIDVSLADENFLPKRKLKPFATDTAAKITKLDSVNPTQKQEEKEVLMLVFEKEKNEDISRLTGKKMLDRTLFTVPTTALPFNLTSIHVEGDELRFKKPVQVNVDFTDQKYVATYSPLALEYANVSYQEATQAIIEKISTYYLYLSRLESDAMTEIEKEHWAHYISLMA